MYNRTQNNNFEMKKEKMRKKKPSIPFEDQKLDLIRLRIKNGYYKNEQGVGKCRKRNYEK